jgi:transposase InsO family protein
MSRKDMATGKPPGAFLRFAPFRERTDEAAAGPGDHCLVGPWPTPAISGEMICDLMIAAVERRFEALKVPHRLEWLSDNSSAYIARQTAQIAAALGIDLLFTPVRSPQSNGMSEAFVKTLKRDYASTVILPDADTILALLPDWIDDCCEVHPHSGLKFRLPREFLRLSA